MKNYKKVFALSALALAIAGCNVTNSSTATTPQTEKSTNAVNLDIEKFTLDNGLEVVLHQDKSDPVVAVAIQYHVGFKS